MIVRQKNERKVRKSIHFACPAQHAIKGAFTQLEWATSTEDFLLFKKRPDLVVVCREKLVKLLRLKHYLAKCRRTNKFTKVNAQ